MGGKEQRLVLVLTENFEKNMKKYANILADEEMLEDDFLHIASIDFVAKEVKYHGYCRSAYQQKAELKNVKHASGTSNQSYWHKERNIHAESFDAVKEFVQENVFNFGRSPLSE